jgi:hypothetical protein
MYLKYLSFTFPMLQPPRTEIAAAGGPPTRDDKKEAAPFLIE